MTDSDSQDVGYAVNRKIKTQSHMRKVSVYEEDKIRWFRCPRRDDYRGGCRTGWRSQTVWRDSESGRVDSELIKRLGPMGGAAVLLRSRPDRLRSVLAADGHGSECEVVVPALAPVKSGERVKTDKRDKLKLARDCRAGELTPVWVPDAAHEELPAARGEY